ncbi:sacsin-like [Patiria miniata]|uniref:Sacsin n=1 Tax=Patiria miniata TaxID=46514 RepID=A0A914AQT7_PATMI|nr:sacsin-like [Patiria miniata]
MLIIIKAIFPFTEDGDFGQQLPPLHIYLKRVLDKYPEGGQILKELVQNADDAKAKNVIFLYDKTHHPSHQLWSETLKDFQGPALYAYNDATFQKQDWYNIQHPEQSGKLEDLTKVGRFGLGFISVYHLTDMPCIISGNKIGFLDPLEKNFIHDPHTNTKYKGRRGKKWKMTTDLLAEFPDQFSPYLIDLFHCNKHNFENSKLEGTVFRFPLRTRESLVSKSVFTDHARVHDLFASFQRDAEISLLFLKHVESIAVYERDHMSDNPRLICKVQIHEDDRHKLRMDRTTFLSRIISNQDIQTMSCVRIQKQTGSQTAQTTSRYIILNSLKSTSRRLQELNKDDELKLRPWMGMSFLISSTAGLDDEQRSGRVFCFLPLPESEKTGLPVHVHGYFGLGDNRRSIRWPDQESQHDNKALWNKLLTRKVFPEVYAKVIQAAIKKSKDPSDPTKPLDVYKAWPSIEHIQANWSTGVKKFLQLLANKPIFYTEHNGGSWKKPMDVYVDPEGSPLISKVLRIKGCPVAQPPHHVLESLKWAGVAYNTVTPALVSNWIRGDPLQFLSSDEKFELLKYVTSEPVCDLKNLRLLPLQSGDFVAFCNDAPIVYIATTENPSSLIPNGASRFAASDLPSTLLTDPSIEAHTQLKSLGVNDVAPLLKEMLPSTWRGGTDNTVPWTPGRGQQPTKEWLVELWRWLLKTELEAFKGIPLIPVARDRIARLQQNKLICQVREGGSYGRYPARLSDNICSFLESVGAVVIRDLPSYISDHPHVNRFVGGPTPEGVMTILEACSQNNLDAQVQGLAASPKDELCTFLSKLQHLTPQQSDILKSLSVFLGSDGKYIAVRTCPTSIPGDYFELPVRALRRRCIMLRSDESDNLLLQLGVKKLSVVEFLQGNVLPAVQEGFYSDDESLKIMKWVLQQARFDHLLTGLKFIPISKRKASPEELFEPSQTLQVMFRGSSRFPVGQYSKGRLLDNLKRVGLKTEADVSPDDVLMCAMEVSQTTNCADVERGSVLLQHINHYPGFLREQVTSNRTCKALYKFLEDLSWVPCEASPPADYPNKAGWIGNSHTLYSPRQVGPIDSALLQGSVLPLVRLHNVKDELLNAFGWKQNLDSSNYQHVERVMLHLKNVANNYQNVLDNVHIVSHTVSEIYSFFTRAENEQVRHLFHEHMSAPQPWVWHGSGFTTPDKMAMSNGTLGVSLTPYLRLVPEDCLQYGNFLNSMGVQETFQDSAFCEVLQIVSQKHEANTVSSEEDYKKDLNLVCNILSHMVNQERFDSKMSGILVPCRMPRGRERKLHMACPSQCLYVDEERLARQIFEEGPQDFDKPIIHELIPNLVAQKLGLQPLSHVIAPVEAVEYGYEVAGPHETTVNAIKRNLDMYKEGPGIFNELIQNADDAGATEVKFLLDWRDNKQTAHNLMGEGMKSCHGPALWVFNDGIFTKDDIANICNIAAQSKKDQLDKVGRFGLGFTSVYHLTDIPSVVSGPYVLICDPRATHLGSRVKPAQPGIKLDLTNESHRRTLGSYPNQFQPYNGIFGCKLPEAAHFGHTLFRLPLRTKAEADGQQPNQISDSVFDSKKSTEPLLEALQKSASTLLLFTQNVVHVTVEQLESENIDDGKPVMSVSVSQVRQLPRSIAAPADDLKTALIDDLKTQRGILKTTAKRVKLPVPDLPIPETTMIVKVNQERRVLGMGGKKKQKKETFHFIISSCMATEEPLDLSLTKEGIKAGVMPCGGVAAQLISGERGLTPETTQGKAFSYLPLAVSTGLPFHVNGNFLLQPNRRQLWSKSSSDTGEFETRWNICFMESVLLRAFVNLLKDLQMLHEKDVVDARNFQCLWPRWSESETDFHPFVKAFYKKIVSCVDAPDVFFHQSKWVSVHRCFFTDWGLTDPEEVRRSITTVLSKHQDPKRWVELERDVVDSIKQVDAQEVFDSNTFNIQRFLSEVLFPMMKNNPQDIESTHRNRIVLYMLDLRLGERKLEDYDELLKATECIPTSPEGEDLARPQDLVNPESPVGSLYSETDCRFPYGELYRKQERLLSLSQLGMASHDLSWEDICERSQSLSGGENVVQRCVTLLKLMDEKLRRYDEPTPDHRKRIQQAAFLPVLEKPLSYPIDWCHSDNEFMSADMLHTPEHQNLLGSVRPLLDENRLGSEAKSDNVKTFLGFTGKQVAVNDVISQLVILINQAPGVAHQTSMVRSIYAYLQSKIYVESPNGEDTFKEEHRAAVNKLRSIGFVFCDGQFRKCKQLAFLYEGKDGPYLYKVSRELTQFSNLLRICGVRDRFQLDDFLETLQLLKETYGEEPLGESDLKTATSMLSEVVSKLEEKHGKNTEGSQESNLQKGLIHVPDICGILRLPGELTYNDMEWEGSRDEEKYTHRDISSPIYAKVLGIVTEREKYIDSCLPLQGFAIDFGQSEQLTDRLKNILRSYPNVSDVFKELLQNADDAGSTEIHFVYDPRHHEAKKVICDSWAAVGDLPSLCVYNDKPFTEADIKGIQKVGVGGKRDDITTTGKFGIGFNAVYHLTDCPSFLSNNDTLCMFDPLLMFSPVTQKNSPGKQLMVDDRFRENFPDMLRGYLEDIPAFNGKGGTVFRFPLRKEQSRLSEETYHPRRVQELLGEFKEVSDEALLFLNNIKMISVSCIDEHTNNLTTEYSISAKLSEQDEDRRSKLAEHLKLFTDDPCETVEPMSHVYTLVTSDSLGAEQTWLISQTLGFEGMESECQSVSRACSLKIPRGGVAALLKDSRTEMTTIQRPKAYCFLPLPVCTELPVHVNGTFELGSARKNLAKGDDYAKSDDTSDKSPLIHRWNRILVEHVLAPAYAKLIEHAGRIILGEADAKSLKRHLWRYDELFPKHLKSYSGEWELLAKATLRYISEKNLKVLPVVHQTEDNVTTTWHHPNSDDSHAFTDNFAVSRSTPRELMRSFLLSVNFNLLASSRDVCSAFQDCDVGAKFVSPQSVVQHLSSGSNQVAQTIPAPLEKTKFKNIQTLLTVFKYCLEGIENPAELNGLPMRVTNDGILREFSTCDGSYVTEHSRVLPCLQNIFLHSKLVSSCIDWFEKLKKKNSEAAYSSGVFKQFTIMDLAQHLGKHLPESWQGCNQHVEWTPDKDGHPSESWLGNLWAFICSETVEEGSLKCINQWPIFPTTSGKLVPPSLSKTVLLLPNEVGYRMEIADVLRSLGLPSISQNLMCELKTSFTGSGTQVHVPHAPAGLEDILQKNLALTSSRQDVTDVIAYVQKTDGDIGHPTPSECDTLLRYFQEGKNMSEDSMKTIKKLPVFKVLGEDNTIDLYRFDYYHTADGYGKLMVEAKTWMDNMHCVILEPNHTLSRIYLQLGITPITQSDMYLKYILPSFLNLSQEGQLQHVEFIRDSVLHQASEPEGKEILERLSHIAFIPDTTDIPRQARFFYDGDNSVFKALIEPIKLLPESMGSLKYFLKKIGLHSEVTQDDFLQFAQEVEKRAGEVEDKEQRETLCRQSRLLTNQLKYRKKLCDPNFLKRIATIKFVQSVPIKAELLHIHPACYLTGSHNNQAPAFIAFQGSTSETHLKLVWSICMILPSWDIPINEQVNKKITVHECLGIETVIVDKVISHAQNICGVMKTKNAIHKEDTLPSEQRETFKDVMGKILGYLEGLNLAEHGEDIKSRLKCTPVCLVEEGRVLVRADQLVFEMDKDLEPSLRPYLYKAPRELAQFDTVLRLLGAQDSCSFDQLAGVLASMKVECGNQRLGPNEQETAVGAVKAMLGLLLRNKSGQSTFSASELYLPNTEYVLRRSTDLYYADLNQMGQYNLAPTDREFIFPVKQCGFLVEDEIRLIKLLPESLRPKNLGDEWNEKPLDTNEDCPAGQHCEYLEGIKRKVKSEEMTRVLLRLRQHQLENKQPSADIKEHITQLQEFDNFVCKTELKLGLYDNNGHKIAEHRHSREAYFDKLAGIMYLEHSSLSQQKGLTFGQIADSCNALLGHLLNPEHVRHCAHALDCQNLVEMNTIISRSDIPEYDITTSAVQPEEHSPGTLIPRDIHHLLDHDPYNRFLVDEIVGYERDIDEGDQLQYDDSDDLALGPDDRVPSETPADGATEQIYAKLLEQIDKGDETVNLSKRYKIDVGGKESIIVKVTRLYKFLRPKKQRDMIVVPLTQEPTSNVPPAAHIDQALPEDMQKDEEQIKKEVDEVFGMPPEERKRVFYRLYRKWHPDKNQSQQERANRAFQFLKQEIDRHERGSEPNQRCSYQYSYWESEVNRDREEARRYQEAYYRSRSSARSNRSYGNFVPPSFTRETPDPRKARLWFRQAKEHLKVAEQTSQLEPVPAQWIAFQVHQVAETALKAAQYSLDGCPDMNCNDLISLARAVCQHRDVTSSRVSEVTHELVQLNCDFSKPRYPQGNSKTSGQEYSDFSTADVLEKCGELLNLVQEIIGFRLF